MSLIFSLFFIGAIIVAAVMVFQFIVMFVIGIATAIGSGCIWLFQKLRS